jgi:hypothetical protein
MSMSSAARTDGGDDGVNEERPDLWDHVGRHAAAMELVDAHHDVGKALGELTEETMLVGEDPSPEQVRTAREALNAARWALGQYAAPAAGVEPWGDPPPRIPMGVLWELTDHPKADGVDPRAYLPEDTDE